MDIREFLKDNTLILDGAMGTYFSELYRDFQGPCEMANLLSPDYVLNIHKQYIKAGANAIKTNTFSVNPYNDAFSGSRLESVIEAGIMLAKKAAADAGREIFLFADIGPVIGADEEHVAEALIRMCQIYAEHGFKNYIFETNSNFFGIASAAERIKEIVPDAFIMTSFSVQSDGYTREGYYYQDLFDSARKCRYIDAYGLNCILSVMHMEQLIRKADIEEGDIVCAMPNGGYPRVVGRRIYYDSDPEFFADGIDSLLDDGVSIVGGCCGTRPEFIRNVADRLKGDAGRKRTPVVRPRSVKRAARREDNRLWSKLEAGKKIIAVELDTPRNSDANKFMSGAWQLKGAGADAITLADCPTARAHMDSCLMACKIKRELDMETIPHMTCRDRNLNATKALLLGLSTEGVRNVLAITGDPIPSAERDEVKSVFQFNSRMLSGFIKSLNENELDSPFRIYGALNVNSKKFDFQLKLAKEKIKNGVSCFLTQPVLTDEALENLQLAHESLDAKILGGIIPVVSSRNGRFMNSEISGITVAEDIIERYEGKSRSECTDLAVEISLDFARRMNSCIDGYYLVTPFSRVDIITRIIEGIREFEK